MSNVLKSQVFITKFALTVSLILGLSAMKAQASDCIQNEAQVIAKIAKVKKDKGENKYIIKIKNVTFNSPHTNCPIVDPLENLEIKAYLTTKPEVNQTFSGILVQNQEGSVFLESYASPAPNRAAISVYPYCYQGTMVETKDGQTKVSDAFLSISSIEGGLVRQVIILGQYQTRYSGSLIGNKILTNDNNDYIPGGNASYNIDVELEFNGSKVSGKFTTREYDLSNPGYGGFGEKGGTVTREGQITMTKCIQRIEQIP